MTHLTKPEINEQFEQLIKDKKILLQMMYSGVQICLCFKDSEWEMRTKEKLASESRWGTKASF